MTDKMITIYDKSMCSGCAACLNVCPTNAISMLEDKEGFLYPSVNIEYCIKCSKCVKACPYIQSEFVIKADSDELSICYAAYNKNDNIRSQSSSGGMFRVFADQILSENGAVFGAAFDETFEVYHKLAKTEDELKALMGSKYLQSRIGMVYREVEKELNEGRKVLFTGVACQIAGLKRYLRIDREKLFCIDVVCCSVGSPKIWREYLQNFFPDTPIKSVHFRDKISGWDSSSMKIVSEKQQYVHRIYDDMYFKSFRNNVFSRPSCATCKFKNRNRVSDITIADCWGFQKIAPEMNDNRGLSSVVVHTQKGMDILNAVTEQLVIKEASSIDVEKFNSNYIFPEPYDKIKRDSFWKDYETLPFKQLIERYAKPEKREFSIFRILKKILPISFQKIANRIVSILTYHSSKHILSEDKKFNETFRFNGEKLPRWFKKKPEWKIIVLYRKYQANYNNIFGKYYQYKLNCLAHTGIDFEGNLTIGKGLIIGHYGKVIINGNANFGEQTYLTHGVTIGRNAVGKRKGVPSLGNRVRIGANAIIVGNITIGDDVVIAPGAFVNFDVPSHSVVVGNPGEIHHKDNATEGYLGTLEIEKYVKN